ncbi:DUF5709 domain-containing protein [Streptomyces sp. 4N509B]|uniref:DUF5709 domain-containing protein n=1 Tax=Streptomyces sp. 4N509B TaxID=3457413 RepID=UPI003FD17526
MSDEAMGDEVYQPQDSDYGRGDDHTDVDMDNALDEKRSDEILDEGYSPPEKPLAVNDPGVTARAQREGETLDERLRREMPEVREPDGDGIGDQPGMEGEPRDEEWSGERRAGRIVKDDYALSDDVVARDVGINGGAASGEEASMHIMRETEEDEEPPPDATR